MGSQRGRRHRSEEEDLESEVGPVISLSSTDDEDANIDLSLEIVERAKKKLRDEEEGRGDSVKREFPGSAAGRAPAIIDLSSTSDDGEGVPRWRSRGGTAETSGTAAVLEESKKKKKKKKKRKKKQMEDTDDELAVGESSETVKVEVAAVNNSGESTEVPEHVDAEADGVISDNIVLRKLLRGPRYFDPGSTRWQSCYNCGEEGHVAAVCTAEKRKKPCFVCGMFGHNANKCTQGQDCFICKRRGHFAKDCPDKQQRISQESKICLICGEMGHDMSSCRNGYPVDDLKKMQCYVCRDFGHFCCVEFIDNAPQVTTCYNCGESGHSGVGCAKPRGEINATAPPTLCYVCGEEGHFARGCSKKIQRSGSSTSTHKSSKNKSATRHSSKKEDFWGSKSLHHEFDGGSRSLSHISKKKRMHFEDRLNMTAVKPRVKHGWIVDDPADWPSREREWKSWKSPKDKSWKSPKDKPWRSPRTPKTPRDSFKHHNSGGSTRQYRV